MAGAGERQTGQGMAPGLRRDARRNGSRASRGDGGEGGYEGEPGYECQERFTYVLTGLSLIGYVLVTTVLVMLVVTATFEKSHQDGALCTVLLALWVVVGWCAYRCTIEDMREKERRRRGEVPPTYSRSNLESSSGIRRGERQPLLGPVAARAGGLIQVQDDETVVDVGAAGGAAAAAAAGGGSFGTDSDE